MADSPVNLRRLFADICRGHSRMDLDGSSWFGPKCLYVKHLSHFDQVDIDLERESYYVAAQKRKIPTLAEKMEWLEKKNLWGKKEESELRQHKVYIDNLEKTKGQVLSAQRKEIEKTLTKAIITYNDLYVKKNKLIGLTCEQYADQKVQNRYVFRSLYKDDKLTNLLFTDKAFDNLEDEELDKWAGLYIKFINDFSHDNLKKIAVAHFFTSYFYMTEEYSNFFGTAMSNLTFYQINLLSYGSYFKSIFQNNKIPDNIREEPEKIEEFLKKSEAMKKTLSKAGNKEGGRVGLVGATKEDMEIIGVKGDSRPSILKKGEIGNINDAVKLDGG